MITALEESCIRTQPGRCWKYDELDDDEAGTIGT